MIAFFGRTFGWLTTFRLWWAYWGRFPEHPLLRLKGPPTPDSERARWLTAAAIGFALMMLPVLWLVGFSVALVAIAVGGTLRGAVAAAMSARYVAYERHQHRLSSIGLAPAGMLGAVWLLAMRAFRESKYGQFATRYIHNAQGIIGFGAMAIVVVFLLGTALMLVGDPGSADEGDTQAAVDTAVGVAVLFGSVGLWLWLDNVQSPLMGVLIGISVGYGSTRPGEAAGAAAGIYTAIQGAMLAAAAAMLVLSAGLHDGLRVLTVCVTLFVTREVLLRVMWHRVCALYNAGGFELVQLLRF
ncbi:MAG: hypothetical protein IPM16_09995 [Chloroflexi bacterium]|nr:hypothetical protein [Chloroflexota bacterium]